MANTIAKESELKGIDTTIGRKINSFKSLSKKLTNLRIEAIDGREKLKPLQEELAGLEVELWTMVKKTRNSFTSYPEGLTDSEKLKFSKELDIFATAKSRVRTNEVGVEKLENRIPSREYALDMIEVDIEDLKKEGEKVSEGIQAEKQVAQAQENLAKLETREVIKKDKGGINPPVIAKGYTSNE